MDRVVVLLGKNEVKQIVLCGAVRRSLERVTETGFSVDAFWLHSVAVALTAQLLNLPMSAADRSSQDNKLFDDMAQEESQIAALSDAELWRRFRAGRRR